MRLDIIAIFAGAIILSAFASEAVDQTNVERVHGHRYHHKHQHRSFTRHADDTQSPQEPDSDMTSAEGSQRKCLGCTNREFLVEYTKQHLKTEILRKLGLKVAPNITKADNLPKHLIVKLVKEAEANVKEMQDEPVLHQLRPSIIDGEEFVDEDDYHFQTKQITILSQEPTSESMPEKIVRNWNIQYFPLSSPQLQNGLWKGMVKAKLYVYMPPAPSPDDTEVWVDVSYAAIDKNDQPFLKQEAISKFQLKPTKPGWAPIDMTNIVSMWFKNQTANYGYTLKAITSLGTKLDVSSRQSLNVPYLVLDIKDDTNNFRRKRTLGKVCSEEDDSLESHCCMWPLTIDFEEEFGWNFIIHPTKYQANFCSGDCQLGVMMPSSLHTHVMQLSNIAPCCSPQKMSGINIIYVDDNKNVVLGKLPKMKVERCGCT